MRGKYSPTVSVAYMKDQSWWTKYAYTGKSADEFVQYDPEGFDSYGYNEDGFDRAGNHEHDYVYNDGDYNRDEDYNIAYDIALDAWDFDGVKPSTADEMQFNITVRIRVTVPVGYQPYTAYEEAMLIANLYADMAMKYKSIGADQILEISAEAV